MPNSNIVLRKGLAIRQMLVKVQTQGKKLHFCNFDKIFLFIAHFDLKKKQLINGTFNTNDKYVAAKINGKQNTRIFPVILLSSHKNL